MIVGHYAAALAAKPLAPKTSLGTLLAAAAFLDLLWPLLLLLGIEEVVIAPGITAFTPLSFVYYPWSHSLLMSLAWGLLFGGIHYWKTGYRAGAAVLAGLVPSHWLLDLIVHQPDLPLVPWSEMRFGLGLWTSIMVTLAVELALYGTAVGLYLKATRAHDHVGAWGFAVFVGLTLPLYGSALFGPPPPSVTAIAWTDMGQWLFIALAAWVDHHRVPR